MDRAQEFAFAWALLDAAAPFLGESDRVQLCIRIGAGEYRESIIELLQRFTRKDSALPPVLAASLWAWMGGFVGSDAEIPLRNLASRIRVSNVSTPPLPTAETPPMPLISRRSERATRRLATAK
jgi:hypothetical protein